MYVVTGSQWEETKERHFWHHILYIQAPTVNIHTTQTISRMQAEKPFSGVIWVGLKWFLCQRMPYGIQQEFSVCQGHLQFVYPSNLLRWLIMRLYGVADYSKPCHQHEKSPACETCSSLKPQSQHGNSTLWFWHLRSGSWGPALQKGACGNHRWPLSRVSVKDRWKNRTMASRRHGFTSVSRVNDF